MLHWLSKLLLKLHTTFSKKTKLFHPFFQLVEITENKDKIIITAQNMNELREIDEFLVISGQPAIRQPILNKQLILMTEASFKAAGYAVLTEDDPNQKFTSTRKTMHQ